MHVDAWHSTLRALSRRARILLAVIASTGVFAIRAEGLRSVHGIVRDRTGQPLAGSVVQIEDMVTLRIRSYIVQRDGKYHFSLLSPDVEYTLRARYRNVWGAKKTLSIFDSRSNAVVTLRVDVKKEE